MLRRTLGEGLVVVEGREHRRQRKILTPAFASEHIRNLIPPIWQKVCELRELWLKEALNVKEGYDVVKSVARTTLDIIGLAGSFLLYLD